MAPRARSSMAAVALSVLLLTGCRAETDASGRTIISTPSLRQLLGMAPVPAMQRGRLYAIPIAAGTAQDQRLVEGRTVRVVSTGNAHEIIVDGRILASDTEDDRVQIQGVYQGGGKTYVLIEEQSGGNACPSMFQAIDLSDGGTVISPQFGNCSDLPRISVRSGALRLSVPAFRAAPATTYVFREGRLSH